uniref:HlyD family efflux transporter periplasmic adaptor subunit n=1 Tax=Bordetella sputigena TaxID=1416810 RepID=UPI0039F10E1F
MKKKTAILAVVVLLAAAAAIYWALNRGPSDPNRLTLYGNVDIRQIALAFDGSDRIAEMKVEEGDRVRAGQVVARLDTRTLALELAQARAEVGVREQSLLRLRNGSRPEEVQQAQAQVLAAQADADLAARQLKRLQGVAGDTSGRGVSRDDLDNAASRLRVAQAQLDNRKQGLRLAKVGPRQEDIAEAEAALQAARAQADLLQHRLDLAELKAPRDAVVRARLLEPGDMASPQRPVYTLAVYDPKWIRAYVGETDLGRVKMGMAAQVVTDSYPGQPITGKVGYISSVAEFTPKNVQTETLRTSLVYEVRVLVDDPQDRLRLGMPATVTIALDPGTAGAAR